MSGKSSMFTSFVDTTDLPSVTLADGSKSQVLGHGVVSPIPNLSLSSVLYVPKFLINLSSVYQLTNSHNCSVTFYPTHCVFQDLCTKKTIGSGQVINGVYHLDSSPPLASVALSSSNSTFQWHYCLGHPPI